METTTAGKLTAGARVLITTDPHAPATFATGPDDGRAAIVTATEKTGRRRLIRTDLGDVEAGPTARVVLAPTSVEVEEGAPAEVEAAPAVEETPPPAPTAHPTAVAAVDPAGRLTTSSTVTVEGRTAPVPARTERAGILAPVRLAEALSSLGWRPVTRWETGPGGGSVTCLVAPVED
ncbi:hypothetical protein [Micromonospora okii]|uniref:hypothetical protein n=1 Tax=Micromonospora okii TaxID=1182970 RepID=UPI001E45E835|nr:hypothetical protein [Micromonospora okii]